MEDDGGDGYRDERCGLAVERGGLVSLLMFVTFIINIYVYIYIYIYIYIYVYT